MDGDGNEGDLRLVSVAAAKFCMGFKMCVLMFVFALIAKTLGDHVNNSIQRASAVLSVMTDNDFSWAPPLKLIWIGRSAVL